MIQPITKVFEQTVSSEYGTLTATYYVRGMFCTCDIKVTFKKNTSDTFALSMYHPDTVTYTDGSGIERTVSLRTVAPRTTYVTSDGLSNITLRSDNGSAYNYIYFYKTNNSYVITGLVYEAVHDYFVWNIGE